MSWIPFVVRFEQIRGYSEVLYFKAFIEFRYSLWFELLTLSTVIFQGEPDCPCSELAALPSVGCCGAVNEFQRRVYPALHPRRVMIPEDFPAALPAPPSRGRCRHGKGAPGIPAWNSRHSKGCDAPPAAPVAFTVITARKDQRWISRGAEIRFFFPSAGTHRSGVSLFSKYLVNVKKKKIKSNRIM